MPRLGQGRQLRTPAARWIGTTLAVLPLSLASHAARADAVMLWNNELLSIIQQTSGLLTDGPPEVAREIAMVDTAMYDAVDAASGETYKPYAFSTGPLKLHANQDAAALQAGFTVMESIFSNPVWGSSVSASILPQITQTYKTGLAQVGHGLGTLTGLALGALAGGTMVGVRSNDGSTAAIENGLKTFTPPGSGTVPGVYVPPSNRPAMFPTWGTVTPFTMTSSSEFPVPPAPDITSPAYAASILETECLGSAGALSANTQSACASAAGSNNFGLPATNGKVGSSTGPTASNTQLALFWNDPGTTLTPPGHWLSIADTLLTDEGVTSELQQARLGAMIGTAEADSGIATWETKYLPYPDGTLWRPITAIQDCDNWNSAFATCDPTWTSVIATPPHPDYLAGHPTFSTAAATVLDGFFGTDDIPFCSTSLQYLNSGAVVPPTTLCYDSFQGAAQDATDSRIYGGIHTTFAVNNGQALGADIGDNILQNFFTQTRHGSGYAVAADSPIDSYIAPIPEPGSLAIMAVALGGLWNRRRRRD